MSSTASVSTLSSSIDEVLVDLYRDYLQQQQHHHHHHHSHSSEDDDGCDDENVEDVSSLSNEQISDKLELPQTTLKAKYSLLHQLLTIRSPHPYLSEQQLASIEKVLRQHPLTVQKKLISLEQIPTVKTLFAHSLSTTSSPLQQVWENIHLYRGDITTLQVDGIVNAANNRLLGCFDPSHRCIDNIIHSHAGPRLRMACDQIRKDELHNQLESIGHARITPAYLLPCQYVLHTVGPQLRYGATPSATEQAQLAAAYRSCFQLARQHHLTSIAFCCISTGLYAFPQELAAQIAIKTIGELILQLQTEQAKEIPQVIFCVFTDKDETIYQDKIKVSMNSNQFPSNSTLVTTTHTATPTPPSPSPSTSSTSPGSLNTKGLWSLEQSLAEATSLVKSLDRPLIADVERMSADDVLTGVFPANGLQLASEWLSDADSILIAGAAGLSAAAGLDYTSSDICHRLIPTMRQYDFDCFYHAIGKHDWPSKQVQWGYLFHQVYLARFHWPKSQIYQQLLELSQDIQIRNQSTDLSNHTEQSTPHSFVYTSNADGMFEQNGFNKAHVLTTQGDYSQLQCLKQCRRDAVFPSQPYVEKAVTCIDYSVSQQCHVNDVPVCPFCQGPMFFSVRGGSWFNEEWLDEKRVAYRNFLSQAVERAARKKKKVVVLEIGAGFNTPTVIRQPMEILAHKQPNVHLIRVNAQYPQLPHVLTQPNNVKAVGLKGDAADIINYLYHKYKRDLHGQIKNVKNL